LVICFAKRYVEYPNNATPKIPNSPPLSGKSARRLMPVAVPRSDAITREPQAAHPTPSAPVKRPERPVTRLPPLKTLECTRYIAKLTLIPARSAINIVYEAESAVKFVVMDSRRRIGRIILSASATEASDHTDHNNRKFGSHVASANTIPLTPMLRAK